MYLSYKYIQETTSCPNSSLTNTTLDHQPHSFAPLSFELSCLSPSSSCSLTLKSGNSTGIILLGLLPGTTEYLSKSVTPTSLLKKSSSSSNLPFTFPAGALKIPNTASEKIVALRKSFLNPGSRLTNCSVAADSMLCPLCQPKSPNHHHHHQNNHQRKKKKTHSSRPNPRNRHPPPHLALPLPIHPQPHHQHAHRHLAHRVRRLPPEEAAVNRRRHHHDPPPLLS